jgi:hypothetical protein
MNTNNNNETKVEVVGVKGVNSKSFRKVFKNQAAFEAWFDKNEGDFEVQGVRDFEG